MYQNATCIWYLSVCFSCPKCTLDDSLVLSLCFLCVGFCRCLQELEKQTGTTPTAYRHETERIQTAFVPSALHPIGAKGSPL